VAHEVRPGSLDTPEALELLTDYGQQDAILLVGIDNRRRLAGPPELVRELLPILFPPGARTV
jgi:hypothetical protein